jgi:hypothetical protein
MRTLRTVLVVIVGVLLVGCDYKVIDNRPPLTPTPIVGNSNPPPIVDLAEFRVSGAIKTATVRVSNSLDGLTQTAAVLPFSQTLNLAGRDSVFLSVDARGLGFGFLHVAIFVDGYVFREAASDSLFADPFVAVSGTWRRAR